MFKLIKKVLNSKQLSVSRLKGSTNEMNQIYVKVGSAKVIDLLSIQYQLVKI